MTVRCWAAKHGRLLAAVLLACAPAGVAAQQPAPYQGPPAPVREGRPCIVRRIVDGDTIDCSRVGRVRLIGVDAPELSQRPYGRAAADALERLLPVGTPVLLEPDVEARDRYDRVLAYVWRGDTLVNWRMVREGWAVLLTMPPNVQYVDGYTGAQRQAREERRGLWATEAFACLPRDYRAGRCR
jgi:micrococcal nuclease